MAFSLFYIIEHLSKMHEEWYMEYGMWLSTCHVVKDPYNSIRQILLKTYEFKFSAIYLQLKCYNIFFPLSAFWALKALPLALE